MLHREKGLVDPAHALTLVIDPYDLWSSVEVQIAADALAPLDELGDEITTTRRPVPFV